MRLRWTLALAFLALAVLQVAVVVPLALQNLSQLLQQQHASRIERAMAAVDAELGRSSDEVRRAMDELAQSAGLEDVARDFAQVPPPAHVTTAASQLMTPRGLDVLALLDEHGRTLSSGHLPARLGEPNDPLAAAIGLTGRPVVPLRVQYLSGAGLIDGPALVTARAVDYGEHSVWAVGGILLGDARARTLSKLTGAEVTFRSGDEVVGHAGEPVSGGSVRELHLRELHEGVSSPRTPKPAKVGGRLASADVEPTLAVIELRFSDAEIAATRTEVLRGFLTLASVGLLLSVALGFLVSRRVTRPVEALTEATSRIGQGAPGVTVSVEGASGELRALVDGFNRMTLDLKAATDQLLASERIAAWQEVARRLAHEIKNPLTPIRMSLETLLAASRRGPPDERFQTLFKESAAAMLEEVDRLKRIVDEFSQFARLPRPTLVPLELAEAVQPVMALYAPHDGLEYLTQLAPGVRVSGDRDQLAQVLVNLVKNAEEAMTGRTGTISVRVLGTPTEAILEVEDEGPGIPEALRSRVFEPYVTTKQQGTGLGLAIASRIAQEHDGRLELGNVEAEAGAPAKGACFRLVLPRMSDR